MIRKRRRSAGAVTPAVHHKSGFFTGRRSLVVGWLRASAVKWEVLLMSVLRFPACLRPGLAALAVLASSAAFGQDAPTPSPDAPAAAAPGAPAPAAGGITLELNKLAQVDNACHAYMILDNQTPERLQDLTVDVYLFDQAGVILRGLALQFADVRPARATVVPFELPDLPCGDVSRVLLNKVLTCTRADGAVVDGCAELLGTRSKAQAAFDY